MKINLTLGTDVYRGGYLNLDPLASPGDPIRTRADICNLDEFVDDAEAEDLIALDVIDFLPSPELDNIIDNWTRKIRHGGTITIGGVDLREVAKAFLDQELTLQDTNQLLYGSQKAPCEYRKATLTLQKMIEVLQFKGFKIIQKRIVNYYYHVKAERP